MDAGLFKRIAYSSDGKRVAVAGGQGGGDGKAIVRVYDSETKKVHLAVLDADAGKEFLAVSWPTADKLLVGGVPGKAANLVTVQLNK
jgi:hypothetical protein